MKNYLAHVRPGMMLVELLLFVAFTALVGGTVISILFATNDQRIRQQTIATVERTGLQLLQGLTWRVERAERVLDPPAGASGSVLALQMPAESDDPLIIAEQSGSLLLVLRETVTHLTDPEPTVSHFAVRNTSPATDHPAVLVSFDLAAPYPLPGSLIPTFSRHFESLIDLLPRDVVTGNACGCAPPSCQSGTYRWGVCADGVCTPSVVTLFCREENQI